MSLANLEINKSEEPVFKEIKKEDTAIINVNKGPEEATEVRSSQPSAELLEERIEDSFTEEKEVKKKGKKSPDPGPKHIALEERFSYDRTDDGDRMLDVRRKLRYYFKSVHEGSTKEQYDNLTRLKAECDAYCRGRFSIFKWGRGGERLKEVKALKRQADEKQRTLPNVVGASAGVEYIYNRDRVEYLTNAGAVVTLGRFLIENPIRLGLTAIALPFWAVNMSIRAIQKRQGKTPIRRLTLPWMHRWGYYSTQQSFKRRQLSMSTYRSFKERFIKHKTDIKAMERAILDTYSTTDEGFDYSDDDFDENEDMD